MEAGSMDGETTGDPVSASYTVRPYESGDERAFRSLFEQVLGGRASEAWFDWKYRANPYVDHVPILLAETDGDAKTEADAEIDDAEIEGSAEADGEVVGARAFFPLELRAGGDEFTAFQPCDTMVAEDHRRQGLFTRMTEAAIERYADDADCFFNFPNEASLPGNLELGWEVVGERATYYRVQDPAAWLSDAAPFDSAGRSGPLATAAEALAPLARAAGRLAAQSYLSIRDRSASPLSEFACRWHDRVPAELLASLAARGTPERIHVARSETFYRWRFDNPSWTYETVVARDGGPTAAVVVASRTRSDGTTVARLADVVPLVGGSERERERKRALSALLPAVLRRYADADLLLAPGDGLPGSLLSVHGFHGDHRPPLSWVARPTVQVARPVREEADWTLGGRKLTDRENWRLALCERDAG